MARPKKETETVAETTVVQEVSAPVEAGTSEYEIADPQELRPRVLPLVIKPTGGEWKNDKQAEYARYLNAYAYKNPAKWEAKKQVLLKRLSEIGLNPQAIVKYRSNDDGLKFVSKLMPNVLER